MSFVIAGIKVTQQQQMRIARACDRQGQLLHLHLTQEVKERIARVIRVELSSSEVGLGNQTRKCEQLLAAGVNADAITFEACAPLRKFCK